MIINYPLSIVNYDKRLGGTIADAYLNYLYKSIFLNEM